MDVYIGHFENTSRFDGNVGLAAHNRGYPVNYFRNIKELEIGDVIVYRYSNKIRYYTVSDTAIIEETDWSYLGQTKDNRITLVTCVEDKPNLRRVVQAKEMIE